MIGFRLFTVFLLFGNFSWANDKSIEQSSFYRDLQQGLVSGRSAANLDSYPECYDKTLSCLTGREIFVQALDELLETGEISKSQAEDSIRNFLESQPPVFDIVNALFTFQSSLPEVWQEYHSLIELHRTQWDQKTREYIESHLEDSKDWDNRYGIAKALLEVEPPIDSYWDGRYAFKPRIYMFCRDNREHPCLMLMKDATGRVKRHRDGTPWTQQALGYSRHRKDFHQTNGNTPSGVFRIDGVMPEADQTLIFGDFRRLILNFVGYSENEENYKKLLPAMTHKHQWWREAVVARNNGRGLFRVHGTGLRSSSKKAYYPFVPTSGCIAKRENTYGKITYMDQRLLLDKLMVASGFDPIYENETRLLGLLYVIDIDKNEAPVNLADLQEVGIVD